MAESMKEEGNKLFLAKLYEPAIQAYTNAIEILSTYEKTNHIYFCNRANARFELCQFEQCIKDCDSSIGIDKTHVKSYFRKAKAMQALTRY